MQIDVTNGRRFTDEPIATAISADSDILLIRTSEGVKQIAVSALRDYMAGDITALTTEEKTSVVGAVNELVKEKQMDDDKILEMQNLIVNYPGAMAANALPIEKSLGTAMTDEMWKDISDGKFVKVRTGNYITLNGRKYWMADADYRLGCGDTALTKHHMLVFPDKSLYSGKMNDTDVTTGGYYGSKMKTSGLADALTTVKNDFGADHILTYRALLSNAVSNGASSGWAWYDSQIDLMSQTMVYGHVAWAGNGFDVGADKSQLAIFKARHDLICNRENKWLRDVQSSTGFCNVTSGGYADSWLATHVLGVWPAFLIG